MPPATSNHTYSHNPTLVYITKFTPKTLWATKPLMTTNILWTITTSNRSLWKQDVAVPQKHLNQEHYEVMTQ